MISKHLVILGANSDIGTALVRRAASQPNGRIVAVSRSCARSPHTFDVKNVLRIGGIDLAKESDLRELSRVADREFREPFAVVHCVGDFWIHKPLTRTPFSEIRQIVESHFLTLCGAARFLTPVMKRHGGGRIVAFSCNSVCYNYPDMAPFTAAKAAIESFVKSYANENAEFGIAASALELPTIRTRKVLIEKPSGDQKNYIRPEDLANFILNHVLTQPLEANGNVIKVFKYSRTFYHSSYYDRNPTQRPKGSRRIKGCRK